MQIKEEYHMPYCLMIAGTVGQYQLVRLKQSWATVEWTIQNCAAALTKKERIGV